MVDDRHAGVAAVVDAVDERSGAHGRLLPAACAATIGVAGIWWMASTPAGELRELLRTGQFWFLDGLLAGVLGTTVVAARHLASRIESRERALFGAVVCTAALLVLIAPRTNRIFYDEHIYQAIGQNLSDLRLAQMCNDGTVEYGTLQCWRSEYNKQPYGYPHLLSVGYRWLGTSESVAHWLNTLVSGGTAGVIFLLTLLLTANRHASIFAAVAFMLIPEQLRWSHSAAAEPSAAFACALAMLAAVVFVRTRRRHALLWTVVASSWAACFRPEAVLIVVVIVVVILLCAREEIVRPPFLWMVALWMLLLLPSALHVVAVRNESWGSSGARFAFPFFWNNVWTNTAFYVGDPRFPAALTLVALAGLSLSEVAIAAAAWFVVFWGVFLGFYAGSYDYGADVRFSLMSHAPLAVLAGIGTSRLVSRFRAAAGGIGLPIAVGALLFQFSWYLPWVRAVGEEAWAARADVAFAREVARTLPSNAIVLTHNPGMFHLWGVSAAQLSFAVEPGYVDETLRRRYADGVYIHWNFWCNVSDPIQQPFCDRALAAYPTHMVQERRARDYRLAFYRVVPPAVVTPPRP
jgi:hypothetical protein